MKIRSMMASLASLTLMVAPLVAQAAEPVRIDASVNEAENMAGGGYLALIGFIAALAALVVIATDSNDEPVSA